MAYRVKATESADRDLDEILTYIAETLANPKAAADFADALEERYAALENHPLMFELSRNERLARMGYRRFAVGSYVALYLVNEERREISIARIFYGRRDYEKYI
jgi:plasmid stabilization system protein ParE